MPVGDLQLTNVGGVTLEWTEAGAGRPILFLHPEIGLADADGVLAAMAGKARVAAPSHPGFGRSAIDPDISSVDDLSYLYLDLLAEWEVSEVTVVGIAFGAWIAAQMAVKSCERIARLVLAAPVGIKIGPRDQGEIADMFMLSEGDYRSLAYHDPARSRIDPTTLSLDEVIELVRNRQATARYSWQPHMYDPKLGRWLHRIRRPTLIMHGEDDRISSAHYARAFAGLIQGATFVSIGKAGHFPHVEQPTAFADLVLGFMDETLPHPPVERVS